LFTTKVVSICIIPVLVAAFVILYFFPSKTKELWAWTIPSEMTAMFMGGGYLAGAWFFFRAVTTDEGHRVTPGLLAISVFTLGLELATLLHWETFNHGHISFWAWFFLYTVTPVLLPILWYNNRRTDPGRPKPDDVVVPNLLRAMMTIGGGVVLAFALVMFLRPSIFAAKAPACRSCEGYWPWKLSPLTVRVLAAFFSFPAMAWALFAFDARWSSFEFPMQTSSIGLALILIASVRAWDEFKTERDAWLYVGALGLAFLWLTGVQVAMWLRSPARKLPAAAASEA
jgi:hypothetical protein